jgi:putative ABC transport system permease protein
LLRTSVHPSTVTAAVRDNVQREGHEFPRQIRTLEATFDASLAQERMLASLSASFGVLGPALAAVGLYGLLAFAMTGRTNEIGVRVALGANRGVILQLIAADVLKMVGMGVAIGVPVAWLLVRSAPALAFDAYSSVGLPLLSAVVLLVLIATIAAAVPAVRAISLNPVDALRHD